MSLTWPPKDPNEVLDYQIDWQPRLVDDPISSSSWVVPSDLIITAQAFTEWKTTVWLSGGTEGATYDVLNQIVTAGGRTMDQTVSISIESK